VYNEHKNLSCQSTDLSNGPVIRKASTSHVLNNYMVLSLPSTAGKEIRCF